MDKQGDIREVIQRHKGVICDLDGTLVDLGVDWNALKKNLSDYLKQVTGQRWGFTPLNKQLFDARKKFGERVYRNLLGVISVQELCEENYTLNENLIHCIGDLNKNQKFGIYSMNTEACVKNFTEKYLKRYPDSIVSKNTCIEPKPTAKDLLKIVQRWNMDIDDIVYIGNSEEDQISGERAGIKTYIISMV